MQLSQMLDEFRTKVQDAPGNLWSKEEAIRYFNQMQNNWARRSKSLRTRMAVSLTASTAVYYMPPGFLELHRVEYNGIGLAKELEERLETLNRDWLQQAAGEPVAYLYGLDGPLQFRLHPKPNATAAALGSDSKSKLKVVILKTPDDLSDGAPILNETDVTADTQTFTPGNQPVNPSQITVTFTDTSGGASNAVTKGTLSVKGFDHAGQAKTESYTWDTAGAEPDEKFFTTAAYFLRVTDVTFTKVNGTIGEASFRDKVSATTKVNLISELPAVDMLPIVYGACGLAFLKDAESRDPGKANEFMAMYEAELAQKIAMVSQQIDQGWRRRQVVPAEMPPPVQPRGS